MYSDTGFPTRKIGWPNLGLSLSKYYVGVPLYHMSYAVTYFLYDTEYCLNQFGIRNYVTVTVKASFSLPVIISMV